MLICLFLGSCTTESTRLLHSCQTYVSPGSVYDFADAGPVAGIIVASVLDRKQVDSSGEYLNGGAIFFLNRRTLIATRPVVQGRDDYPFKPLGIDVIQGDKELTLVVVNAGFQNQRSIEFYQIVRSALVFQRRSRIPQLRDIVDVVSNGGGDLLVVRRRERWFYPGDSGDLMVYRNRIYRFFSVSLGQPERFGQGDHGSVLVPGAGSKALYELPGEESARTVMRFPWPPVAAKHTSNGLLIMQRDPQLKSGGRLSQINDTGRVEFESPVDQPETMLVLSGEKKIVIAGEDHGTPLLALCDQP